MADLASFYRGKRVFITGHTGFKGAWLTRWLLELGAEVTGYSKDVPTKPSVFEALELAKSVRDLRGDIRDLAALTQALKGARPDALFHLAAQPLVRASYREPVETFSTNVLGTVHVLEAARQCPSLRVLVNVTSDKCYENREESYAYRETDPMGGADPYSASKGCAELAFSSYFRSFFSRSEIRAASARAGNVIGGGDWAEDRLIPDCVRAWSQGRSVTLRNPASVRPWQHVLEPLSGYLTLGAALGGPQGGSISGQAFNFGPGQEACQPVEAVVRGFQAHWPQVKYELAAPADGALHEAKLLQLDCGKASELLGWRPRLRLEQALEATASWYRAFYEAGKPLDDLSRAQIAAYLS